MLLPGRTRWRILLCAGFRDGVGTSRDRIRPTLGRTAMTQPSPQRETSRWAPWRVYLILILGANYLRQLVLPFGTVPEWADALLAVSIAAALFLAVTAVYRAGRRQ
jgi:hypothetical protein